MTCNPSPVLRFEGSDVVFERQSGDLSENPEISVFSNDSPGGHTCLIAPYLPQLVQINSCDIAWLCTEHQVHSQAKSRRSLDLLLCARPKGARWSTETMVKDCE